MVAATLTTAPGPVLPAHPPVQRLRTSPHQWAAVRRIAGGVASGAPVDEALVAVADRVRDALPEPVRHSLDRFAADAGPSGALLVRGLPVGTLPATPASPVAAETAVGKDRTSELVLLAVARTFGEPVGYRPEHGGALVQNLLPVAATAATQTSTSSSVDLEFHTETAFHPHRPRHLILTCLRGDAAARTYVCSIRALLPHLTAEERATLAEPRYRTRVDESFGGHPGLPPGPLVPVLSGDPEAPTLVFDAELMHADHAVDTTDPGGVRAAAALARLRELAVAHRQAVVLEPGDLLVVDNHAAIHGRSAFRARYDGTDRWLQRAFVVDDLAPSASDRTGRIIDTRFA